MGNIRAIKNEGESDIMTISGLVELSKKVGENSSDIEKLKEQTNKLDGLKMEINEVKSEQKIVREKLEQLVVNDGKIESGVETIKTNTGVFRRWLFGTALTLICAIIGTLFWGLEQTRKDQDNLKGHIYDKMQTMDKIHTDNYKNMNGKIDKMIDILLKQKDSQ